MTEELRSSRSDESLERALIRRLVSYIDANSPSNHWTASVLRRAASEYLLTAPLSEQRYRADAERYRAQRRSYYQQRCMIGPDPKPAETDFNDAYDAGNDRHYPPQSNERPDSSKEPK